MYMPLQPVEELGARVATAQTKRLHPWHPIYSMFSMQALLRTHIYKGNTHNR